MHDDVKIELPLDLSEELNVFEAKDYDLNGLMFYPVLNTKIGHVDDFTLGENMILKLPK